MSDQLTVIVVTYNSAHCLRDLASSLAGLSHVTVVDNGSEDGIESAVRQHLPQANLIKLTHNQGFGAANNMALKIATTPFALLLNPDCQLQPGALEQLLNTVNSLPEAAVIAPQIVKPNGDLELSYRWPQHQWTSSGPAAQGLCCVGFVTGAAMLLRLSALKETGFFDENFFLYYEDEDLCTRLFKAGHSLVIDPQAQAVHASRSSVKEGFPWQSEYIRGFHHAQSKLIYERKHGSQENAHLLRWRVLVLALLSLPFRLLWPQPRYLVRLVGRISGLIRYPGRPERGR